MKLIKQPGKEKILILKQKALSFSTTNTFCIFFFSQKIAEIFYFWANQGLKVPVFFLIKSFLVAGSELTFQSCIVKNCVKKDLLFLVSHKGPQWLGLRDRIF